MGIDQHEAAGIAQPGHGCHRSDALECRQDHAVREGQLMFLLDCPVLTELGHIDLAGFHRRYLGVGDPLDVALAHFAFHQSFAVAHTAEPQMADIRFA